MPSCSTCGAFVGADGKWAPAQQLLLVSTERDKAVVEATELGWHVGNMRGEVAKAQADLDARKTVIQQAMGLLAEALKIADRGDAEWKVTQAFECLKGAV